MLASSAAPLTGNLGEQQSFSQVIGLLPKSSVRCPSCLEIPAAEGVGSMAQASASWPW